MPKRKYLDNGNASVKKRKNLAKAENAPTRDAFLVRTYNPSGEAVKRILKWCSEIKMDKKVMTDVWVSIDCTLELSLIHI